MSAHPLPAPLAALKEFVRPRAVTERCDLCSAAVGERHDHLLDPVQRLLKCACPACALLFPFDGQNGWKRVRPFVEALVDLELDDALWAQLQLPIDLAYFVQTAGSPLAFFPSPAGATESRLPPTAWQELVERNPRLKALQPDVEALLVNRVGGAREHYRVSIDECFTLVGLIRTQWKGFTGGSEAWAAIHAFFDRLRRLGRA